jgi:hypothetical protein
VCFIVFDLCFVGVCNFIGMKDYSKTITELRDVVSVKTGSRSIIDSRSGIGRLTL